MFQSIEEHYPGNKWLDLYKKASQVYKDHINSLPNRDELTYEISYQALALHMPEFIPLWNHLMHLSGDTQTIGAALSLYNIPSISSTGSQAIWTKNASVLVKNYGSNDPLFDRVILKSAWHNINVIATSYGFWGALDGMNAYGLALSFTHGGTEEQGHGFHVSLVIRYILEFCTTTQEAITVLQRIPINESVNISILDRYLYYATIQLSPFRPPVITYLPYAVNHQGNIEWTQLSHYYNSIQREKTLISHLNNPQETVTSFLNTFEIQPLFFSHQHKTTGTHYTAIYNPSFLATEFRWPSLKWYLSFHHFEENSETIDYSV